MNQILSSWGASLALLKPQNLKLLALATLNAWIKAWKVGWPYVGTALAGAWGTNLLFTAIFSQDYPGKPWVMIIAVAAYVVFLAAAMCLFLAAARPSLDRKDSRYFVRVVRDQIPAVAAMVFILVGDGLLTLFRAGSLPGKCLMIRVYILVFLMVTPLATFLILSLLDFVPWSLKSYARAWRNAFVLFLYNFPLMCVGTVMNLAVLLLCSLFYFMPGFPLVWIAALSLIACFWTVVYTKRIHDQPHLYI